MRSLFIRFGSFVLVSALLALGSARVYAATASYYWDIDGATAGSGNPSGMYSWSDPYWTADSTGSTATTTLPLDIYATAAFSAGTDGTGTYTVTVPGGTSVPNVTVEEGDVTLRLTGTTYVSGSIGAKMLFDGGTLQLVGVSDGRSGHSNYDTSANFRITDGTTAVFDARQTDLQNPYYYDPSSFFWSFPGRSPAR